MIKAASILILFSPLVSCISLGSLKKFLPPLWGGIGTTSLLLFSALSSLYLIDALIFSPSQEVIIPLFSWIQLKNLDISWSIALSTLTIYMMCLITTLSTFLHLYFLIGQHKNPEILRLMSYFGLFTFFLLMLVSANDMVQLFFGWEGVTLCPYLLNGFWHLQSHAYSPSLKIFLIKRISDILFSISIIGILYLFQTTRIDIILTKVPLMKDHCLHNEISVITLLLFLGIIGEFIQGKFYAHLIYIRVRPVPILTLCHFAIMIAAGIFVMVRLGPLYKATPYILNFTLGSGITTILFAGICILFRKDIKRTVIYSTCRQLSMMRVITPIKTLTIFLGKKEDLGFINFFKNKQMKRLFYQRIVIFRHLQQGSLTFSILGIMMGLIIGLGILLIFFSQGK